MTTNSNEQAQANTLFVERIARKFEYNCERIGIEPSHEELVKYLLQHSVINTMTVNRYITLDLYHEELYKANGLKSLAILNLETRVPYRERTIWYILDKLHNKFFPKKIPFAK